MTLFGTPPHDDPEPLPGFDPEVTPGFLSADEVPAALLDPAPVMEGDDRVNAPDADRGLDEFKKAAVTLPVRRPVTLSADMSKPFGPKARARIVPLRRQLKRGMRGKDVIATKRALSHAGFLKWPRRWSRRAGPKWQHAVARFQTQHNLQSDGVYGPATHRKLVQLGHFDKYGALLMATAPRPVPDKRREHLDRIEAYLFWAYHNRDRIWYLQRRPMQLSRLFSLPTSEDCSEFATRSYKAGGSPDPNGNNYNGSGYTGSMAVHGVTSAPQAGALNLYGFGWPYLHVTIGVGADRCMSMGSSPGPFLLPVKYRGDYSHTRVYRL